MCKRAASPSQKLNPCPGREAQRGVEPSRAHRSRDGLRGSGSSRGPRPTGTPVFSAGVFSPRGCRCRPWLPPSTARTRPRLPRSHDSRVGRTHGVLSTGLPVEESSPEILTSPLFRPCKAGAALVPPGARLTGGRGCSGCGRPGKGPAARVLSRRPRGTAIRDGRFSFFLLDVNSEHPSLSLPKPPTWPRTPGRR